MINLNTGYDIQSGVPVDSRMILSKAEMKAVSDGIMDGTIKNYPDNFFCICKDDVSTYVFNKTYKDTAIGRYLITPKAVFKKVKYGFHIDGTQNDSFSAVTYLSDCDNADYSPAAMNFDTDTFSYGSWKEDEFFMPRPCMLKNDGTVDYYLDPNDYGKKEDGTASDITNLNYAGNAMMEWGRNNTQIWLKVVPDTSSPSSANVYISNTKIDDDFKAFPFIGPDGTLKQHFYTPIYNGIMDSNGRLRSMSTGDTPIEYQTALEQIDAAKKNGDGWTIETFGDRCLILFLLMMLSKSKAPNAAFGIGDAGRLSASSSVFTGSMNTKGLFWGKKTTSTSNPAGVKVFGMENYWGCVWRRILGIVNDNGTIKYKMCYGTEDGSSVLNYDFTGSSDCGYGFVNSGVTITGGNVNFIKSEHYSTNGTIIPMETTTTSNNNYRSYLYYGKSYVNMAIVGGFFEDISSHVGPFNLSLIAKYSDAGNALNACLSYR